MSADTDRWVAESTDRIRAYDLKRRQQPPRAGRTMPELEDLVIGGSRMFRLAVLSIDIRGFTGISLELERANRLPDLARFQALYLTEMSAIIRARGGVTEKYTGDGVMGLFGTESETTSNTDVDNAVSAALDVNFRVPRALNPYLKSLGLPELQCGMGIDHGAVLIERVGLWGENQLSLAGATVSLAAKLQGAAEPWQILIGEDVYTRLSERRKKFVKPAPKAWTEKGLYKAYLYDAGWAE